MDKRKPYKVNKSNICRCGWFLNKNNKRVVTIRNDQNEVNKVVYLKKVDNDYFLAVDYLPE